MLISLVMAMIIQLPMDKIINEPVTPVVIAKPVVIALQPVKPEKPRYFYIKDVHGVIWKCDNNERLEAWFYIERKNSGGIPVCTVPR